MLDANSGSRWLRCSRVVSMRTCRRNPDEDREPSDEVDHPTPHCAPPPDEGQMHELVQSVEGREFATVRNVGEKWGNSIDPDMNVAQPASHSSTRTAT